MSFLKYWLPLFLWAAFIFFLSSRPSAKVSGDYWINFAVFKTLHVFEYFIFYLLCYRALKNKTHFESKKILILSFISTILYAISDEIHQLFVPTREGRVQDVFIDSIGGGAALIILWKYLVRLPSKLLPWVKILELA